MTNAILIWLALTILASSLVSSLAINCFHHLQNHACPRIDQDYSCTNYTEKGPEKYCDKHLVFESFCAFPQSKDGDFESKLEISLLFFNHKNGFWCHIRKSNQLWSKKNSTKPRILLRVNTKRIKNPLDYILTKGLTKRNGYVAVLDPMINVTTLSNVSRGSLKPFKPDSETENKLVRVPRKGLKEDDEDDDDDEDDEEEDTRMSKRRKLKKKGKKAVGRFKNSDDDYDDDDKTNRNALQAPIIGIIVFMLLVFVASMLTINFVVGRGSGGKGPPSSGSAAPKFK